MKTPFEHHQPGLTSPAVGSLAVTPSDTADLASAIRAVTIGGEGVIACPPEPLPRPTRVAPIALPMPAR